MAPLVSKEDAILSKLLWIQKGSHKSRHDVIEMLKRDEDLDRNSLQEHVTDPGASRSSGGDRTEEGRDRLTASELTGDPSMRAFVGRFGTLIASSLLCCCLDFARGDEPVKPTAPASEANPAVPAAGHSVHGEAFNDGPRHAAYLMPGMGKVHFPVTSKKPEAQAFIDQGVAQLHSFYYFESERSFRQAAKIDPDCAMAYWGMAMSNINNAKRAQGFLKEARKRAASLSRHESLYLEALESFFKEGDNAKTKRQGWLQGLETIVQEFPGRHRCPRLAGDGDVAECDGRDRQPAGGRHAARHGLQVEPMHPGAHHYRIHLWDGNQAGPRREIGGALRQDRARDRTRLAHAGPYLHRAEAVCRRRLSAGRLGPRRPRLHDPRPGDAVRDSQLRAQQPVALHEPEPHRPGSRRHRRGAQPGRAAARSAARTGPTTAARRSGAAGPDGRRS